MFKMGKQNISKILAGFLVFAMIINMLPVGVFSIAFAAGIDSYTVQLTDGKDMLDLDEVEITMTDKENERNTSTAKTVDGVAVFENFVNEETTYIVSVKEVFGYEKTEDSEVVVEEGKTSTEIVMNALTEVKISGIVTDETGAPYKDATVKVSGYVNVEVTTNAEGKYEYTTYATKENRIEVFPKEGDKKYNSIPSVGTYSTDEKDVNYQFAVKTFTITTSAGNNGSISATETEVLYGDERIISIKADEGYRIKEVYKNDKLIAEAKDEIEYEVPVKEIDKNYTISVSFYKATYTVSFNVTENGKVKYKTDDVALGGEVTDVTVEENGSVNFEAIANKDDGYHVEKVVVGEEVKLEDGNNDTISFSDVITSKEINKTINVTVVFAINEYKVTIGATENGKIVLTDENANDSETELTIKHGEKVYIQAISNEHYELSEINANDVSVSFKETKQADIYETDGVEITTDTVVSAVWVNKDVVDETSYNVTLPTDANSIVGDVTYVADGSVVSFIPKEEFKRVRITYIEDGKEKVKTGLNGESVQVILGNEDAEKVIAIEVSKNETVGQWSEPVKLNITYDALKPNISKIENSGKWFKEATAYSFTVADANSGVKAVKYSKDDDVANATVIESVEGKYSFLVENEYEGIYNVWVIDSCNNVLKETVDVKLDFTAPEVTEFSFSTSKDVVKTDGINFAKFGTISKETLYLTVKVNDTFDDKPTAGLKAVALYADDELVEEKTVENDEDFIVFELKEEGKKELYAVVKDAVGNTSVNTKPLDVKGDSSQIKSNFVQITTNAPEVIITPDIPVYKEEDKLWYNGNVSFVVTVNDKISGVESVDIKINGKSIEKDFNDVSLEQDFTTGENPVSTIKFNVNTEGYVVDGENKIEVTATSASGVPTVESKLVHIDTTSPNVTGFEITPLNNDPISKIINFLSFGTFFNEKVKIEVSANDDKASSCIESITLFLGEESITEQVVENKATFVVTKSELEENSVYSTEISAVATDNVGNTTEEAVNPTAVNSNIKNSYLMLETVNPSIKINPVKGTKEPVVVGGKKWYAEDVEFDVNVEDADSGISNVVISVNGKKLVTDSFDKQVKEPLLYKVNTNNKDVKRAEDGSYTVIVSVTDNAGNFSEKSYVIYKDDAKPYITVFDFEPEKYVEGNENIQYEKGEPVLLTDYGFYFKSKTKVIITAADDKPSSGVKTITYYTFDKVLNETSKECTEPVNSDNQIVITIPAGFKGQIYAKATDNVENTPDKYASPNGAILESQEKHDKAEYDHVVFEKAETLLKTSDSKDATELYSSNVNVTLTVEDRCSGIRKIEWSVKSPYDKENNQSGTIVLNNDKSLADESVENINKKSDKGWKQVSFEDNLVTKMQKVVCVNNDSNDIVVKVKMIDRAGNITEDEITFSIDKTAPTITIEYGDKEVHDEQNTNFFSTNRTATITVKERNFNASDIVFAITNTDKVVPSVDLKKESTWETKVDKKEPNSTVHVAKVKYDADGDYTFDIFYKDRAENEANKIKTHKFTIDKTKPQLKVVYDNNSPLNGNYYKADRIATLTIKEHNFDSSRVNVIGTATDNGTVSSFPSTSKWSKTAEDTYTATIAYTADSKYRFDVEFNDKANNSISDYTPDEFVVDKTAPNLSISGVADNSANSGDVIPVISYSDTNFNKDNVRITLSGINLGSDLQYEGAYSNAENGQSYTYANFEKKQEVDDIYTLTAELTDFAGNTTTSTVTFSVNRFGSVYDLRGLKEVLSKYLQTEQDIVFTETNVDTLDVKDILVKLTKNGNPSDLVQGKDYTVTVKGGDGQWSIYTYTIKKALFAEDGRYSISIYSKDAAGNVNENIDETKSAEISFGVDKTKPVVVPIDLESGVQYALDMKSSTIEIKDNLVLENVKIFLNEEEIKYVENGESYIVDIPKSNSKQNIKIVATDAAGNEEVVEIKDFLVNANLFVRWYNNTPLFVGSIIGVFALAIAIARYFMFEKKVKEEEQ